MLGAIVDASRGRRIAVAVFGMSIATLSPATADTPVAAGESMKMNAPQGELIPRQVLFGNPDRAMPQLSPDGKWLSYLAARDGVLNIWVAPVGDLSAAKAITHERERGIRNYQWAYTAEQILFMQDTRGDENFHVFVADVMSGTVRDVTPFDDVQARVSHVSSRRPDTVLVAINNRVPQLHDVHSLNVRTGELKLVLQNDGFISFEADEDLNVRFAMRMTEDGGMEILKRVKDGFEPFTKIPQEDTLTTAPIGFDASGRHLYMADSRGRNTAGAVELDCESGTMRVLADDPRADVGSAMLIHPTQRTLQAVSFNYERSHWKVLDPAIQKDLDLLAKVEDAEIEVLSRTLDDRHWLVQYWADAGPVRWYLYDRDSGKTRFLFTNRSQLQDVTLGKMHARVLKARDGMNLVSYLTLPVGSNQDGGVKPDSPLPLVLVVHGGPWARDDWGYDPVHQWLANRGYAVLSVNFRGSTGFGKQFINAADQQWGRTMHDDLLDAVDWAVREGIADRSKVAVLGGSYGGYATLWSVTNSPDVFACGVDIVGPSNLVTLLNSIPPYWAPMIEMFAKRVGDPRTTDGKKLLEERSPLNYVSSIKKPLLIAQGANDPRVKQAESDQIVAAMQQKGIPVTYVLYPDEGHGFNRPENSLSFWAVAEGFLAKHLGGKFEPVGDDFQGSTLQIKAGAEHVPGLKGVKLSESAGQG